MTSDFNYKKMVGEAEFKLIPEPDVPNMDYAEFTIRTIKKVVKREDILVRQVFYTGLSTYTFDRGV